MSNKDLTNKSYITQVLTNGMQFMVPNYRENHHATPSPVKYIVGDRGMKKYT